MNFKGHLIWSIISFIILAISIGLTTAMTDSLGDAPYPDITELSVNVHDGSLNILIRFAEPVDSYTLSGDVFIDTDQNPATGYSKGSGSDYVYHFGVMPIPYSDPIKSATLNDVSLNQDSFMAARDLITIGIPLSLLGNDDGAMDIFVLTYAELVAARNFDRAPDSGTLSSTDGKVRASESGFTGRGSLSDARGDSSSPEITGLSVDVKGGRLNVAVIYDQDIKNAAGSYGSDVTGTILIDADQDLSTGFVGTGDIPPTFGIDYIIKYTLGNLLGDSAELEELDLASDFAKLGIAQKQTKGTVLGAPYNDATLRVEGDRVLLSIPLSLMGGDEGAMDLIAKSYTIHGILAGKIDRVPDVGALNTRDGLIRVPLSCKTEKVAVTDPAGDSPCGGNDGDDLISLESCLSGDLLLITVGYSSLSPEDGAITEIFLDTDQNPDTKEYSIISYFYNGELTSNIQRGSEIIIDSDQLVAVSGNKMYLSIPLKLFKLSGGPINIYAETAIASISRVGTPPPGEAGYVNPLVAGAGPFDKYGRSAYDRIPNTGVLSL